VFSQGSSADYNVTLATKDDNKIGQTSFAGMWVPGKSIDIKIEGSLYLFPSWNGMYKVVTKNGDTHQLFNLNYNLKSLKLESVVSKDSIFQYDLLNLDYIVNNNKTYKAISEGGLNGLFFEVFNGDKVKLYKKFYIVVQEGVINPLTQVMMSESKYVQKTSYYFWNKGEYIETKLSKSNVLKILGDKKDVIKEFASKNNLSYSSDEDLKIVLNHYSSL
jgi:hypothetical protein